MKTISAEEFSKAYGKESLNSFGSTASVAPTPSEPVGEDIRQIGTDIGSSLRERQKNVQEIRAARQRGEQGFAESAFQEVGQGAGFVSDVFSSLVKGAVKTILPQQAEDAVKSGLKSVVEPIVNTDIVKSVLEKYNSLPERERRNLDSVLGIGSLGLDIATAGGGQKAIEVGIKTGMKGAEAAAEGAKAAVKGISEAAQPVTQGIEGATRGVGTILGNVAEQAKQIPSRIGANVAEKQAQRQSIGALKSDTLKRAALDGIEVSDLKYLEGIKPMDKAPLRELFNATRKFESGASKTNPIEIVGKPIVQRLKTLESESGKVGQQLGKAAENLGLVTQSELFDPVLNGLKRVRGLEGLSVGEKGVLDFRNTILTLAETASDRKAIQSIFSQAIKGGSGASKHRLRQGLFESLRGKQRSLATITDTQERAYQAIRQSLSDVLDSKSAGYKALNQKYATLRKPLEDMRRLMKGVGGADEDILNMSAGLLARRLTSMGASNPQIRAILRAMDAATKTMGKTTASVENLQDFYNILDKYYNIAGKTGFQGQVKSGIDSSSLKGALVGVAKALGGKSDAVKRRALEKALEEALK